MGRVSDRIKARAELQRSEKGAFDHWLVRLAHLSQFLLLLLGGFGYYYTVLPVYQRELLEEEIAQKRLELREKEAQSAKLASEILEKSRQLQVRAGELQDREKQLRASRDEARETYRRLYVEYVGEIFNATAGCAYSSYSKPLTGQEFGVCVKDFEISAAAVLLNLRPADRDRLLKIGREEFAAERASFNAIVEKQRALLRPVVEEKARREKEAEVASARRDGEDLSTTRSRLSEWLATSNKISELRELERKIYRDSVEEFDKLLHRIGDRQRRRAFASSSP